MRSWYPATELTTKQLNYLKCVQAIWRVYDSNMNLVPYTLAPHQIEWHSQDIAVQGSKAKDRVVVKSRNTSFTTSALISNLMAVPSYPNQILPFVRLNQQRALDLIEDCKVLIRNMRPILIDGKYYPFHPAEVDTSRAGSIRFPNGVEFRAMPANAQSAETIRGMRIFGSAGIIDESNFMHTFRSIYISLRDASRGSSIDGKKQFQMNIGTTRKGRMTNFNIWFEDILKNKPDNVLVFFWPVLKHPQLSLNRSLIEQAKELELVTIVDWHNIVDLENKRKEDVGTFKEEYMGELVDSDTQLYPHEIVEAAVDDTLSNSEPVEGEQYAIGIDPAATSDFFAISIFDINTKVQKFLDYSRGIPLTTMEKYCESLVLKWRPVVMRIDANGLGYQLGQNLKNKFGIIIQLIRGTAAVKNPGKVTGSVPIKEYLHTNMLKLMNYNEIRIIPDEMQIRHYYMWNQDYTCTADSTYGHGDTTISNGLALLPLKWRYGSKSEISGVRTAESSSGINDKPLLNEKEEDIIW